MLSQIIPVHVPLRCISWRSILILCSYLRLGLPGGLFLSGFLTKILYAPFIFPPPLCFTYPAHLVLDLINGIIFQEECRSWISSLCFVLLSLAHRKIYTPYGMLHRASDLKEICLEDLGVDGNNLADHTLITTVLLCAYKIVSRHVNTVTCRS